MEAKQIKQELSQVELIIGRALQAIKDDRAAPQDLKESVQALDSQAKKAKQARDETILAQYVVSMEAASDRARDACERANDIDSRTKTAVLQVHQQLSGLKHQLH
jgi:DNA polymerase I-like protein with 3'-5' exonuclease and polymerase domains